MKVLDAFVVVRIYRRVAGEVLDYRVRVDQERVINFFIHSRFRSQSRPMGTKTMQERETREETTVFRFVE